MPTSEQFSILDKTIRVDKKTEYICLTDLAKLKGDGRMHISNWLRAATTVYFIEAWEKKFNPDFNVVEFDYIKEDIGSNLFKVSVEGLNEVGCIGVFSKKGRYGGTYANIQWAIHFSNWMDPRFYMETLSSYLEMHRTLYGVDAAQQRFARELAAETYPLATGTALSALPPAADALFEKRIASVEADILNLALWGMTAQEWRIKFPQTDARKNMRDYATPEELKTLSALQVLSQEMHENGYSSEERLDRLREKAQELIVRFCAKPAKQDLLLLAQHKRGWGAYEF